MQVVLVMFRDDGERRSFSVVRDITVLGRREDCDLRIPLGDISRKHARLIRSDDRLRLEDLGSSNGTFWNGQRITSIELQAGDTVALGPVTFVVQIDGSPADEDLRPYTDQVGTPQDTSVTAAAVAVGSLQEVEPAAMELPELPELEEITEDEEDLGAAPLIAADDEELASLEPVSGEDSAVDAETINDLEPLEPESIEETPEPLLEEPEPLLDEPEPVSKKPAARAAAPVMSDDDDLPVPQELPTPSELATPPVPAKKTAKAAVPPPLPEPAENLIVEPVEGELQSSDQFEAISEQSAFDILIDDPKVDDSSADEVQIDWNQESKA